MKVVHKPKSFHEICKGMDWRKQFWIFIKTNYLLMQGGIISLKVIRGKKNQHAARFSQMQARMGEPLTEESLYLQNKFGQEMYSSFVTKCVYWAKKILYHWEKDIILPALSKMEAGGQGWTCCQGLTKCLSVYSLFHQIILYSSRLTDA